MCESCMLPAKSLTFGDLKPNIPKNFVIDILSQVCKTQWCSNILNIHNI